MNINDDVPSEPDNYRYTCLQMALFHLQLGLQALADIGGIDLTTLDDLIEHTQRTLSYYQPAL